MEKKMNKEDHEQQNSSKILVFTLGNSPICNTKLAVQSKQVPKHGNLNKRIHLRGALHMPWESPKQIVSGFQLIG